MRPRQQLASNVDHVSWHENVHGPEAIDEDAVRGAQRLAFHVRIDPMRFEKCSHLLLGELTLHR
jgi:hypothetical protein